MDAITWLLIENAVLILLIAGFAVGAAKHSLEVTSGIEEIVEQLKLLNEKQGE